MKSQKNINKKTCKGKKAATKKNSNKILISKSLILNQFNFEG
jgi:hypothetical protein